MTLQNISERKRKWLLTWKPASKKQMATPVLLPKLLVTSPAPKVCPKLLGMQDCPAKDFIRHFPVNVAQASIPFLSLDKSNENRYF